MKKISREGVDIADEYGRMRAQENDRMYDELNDTELSQLIRVYCNLVSSETIASRRRLFHGHLCVLLDQAKKRWFPS